MSVNFNNLKNIPDLTSTLKVFEDYLLYQKINCCRVGIVDEYDNNTRIAKVIIANKLQTSDKVQNYAPIYAKVLFFGWKNKGITHPVVKGSEGLLLFSDREIDSWFNSGNVSKLANVRKHDKTDAIFISGLLSSPNSIASNQSYLDLYYGNTHLKIAPASVIMETTDITLNAPGGVTMNTPDVTMSGNLNVKSGVSAVVPCGSSTLTFSNGILTGVS